MISKTPRREFLARTAGSLGAAGVLAAGLDGPVAMGADPVGSTNEDGSLPLSALTYGLFSEIVGDRFSIHREADGPLDVQLIEATSLLQHVPESTVPDGDHRCFSIVFRGSDEAALDQRIHDIEHPAIGRCGLFLVPIGPDAHGMRYEAVFNSPFPGPTEGSGPAAVPLFSRWGGVAMIAMLLAAGADRIRRAVASSN